MKEKHNQNTLGNVDNNVFCYINYYEFTILDQPETKCVGNVARLIESNAAATNTNIHVNVSLKRSLTREHCTH